MAYIWMSHVIHMKEWSDTYEWVMPHRKWVVSHIWMSLYAFSRISTRHVAHMDEYYYTCEWVMSHEEDKCKEIVREHEWGGWIHMWLITRVHTHVTCQKNASTRHDTSRQWQNMTDMMCDATHWYVSRNTPMTRMNTPNPYHYRERQRERDECVHTHAHTHTHWSVSHSCYMCMHTLCMSSRRLWVLSKRDVGTHV